MVYAHCHSLLVSKGQEVSRGSRLLLWARQSSMDHLHFEVRINGERTNPMNYF